MLIQALLLSQFSTPFSWADPKPFLSDPLRSPQRESETGLEEIKERLSSDESPPTATGLEQPKTVEEAMKRWFNKGSGREDEEKLENFLAERWKDEIEEAVQALDALASERKDEDVEIKMARVRAREALSRAIRKHERQIEEFVERLQVDRRRASLLGEQETIGPYSLPAFTDQDVPAPGQVSGAGDLKIEIPSDRSYYELERLHLMAKVAIQRALGRQVVVNIGIGFVGTAVSTATAVESRRKYRRLTAAQREALTYRGPLEGTHEAYFVIAYQRPSPASAYKVPAMNAGRSPIASRDKKLPEKIAQAASQGHLFATYLQGAIAVGDVEMVETELNIAKVLPESLEQSKIADQTTLRLMREVGLLMQKDALVIVESTIAPGFTRNRLLPALNEALRSPERAKLGRELLPQGQDASLAHAFQRLEPRRLYQTLLEYERVGAGVNSEATRRLKEYLETVGFTYRILRRVEAVEFMKTLENAWTFGLYELMGSFLRAAEIVGVDAFEIAQGIARARPKTHGLITRIPTMQPGGFCVPKELLQIVVALGEYYGLTKGEIVDIFYTRLHAAIANDFRARISVARAEEALAELGKRLDDARLHVFGVAFGARHDDTRTSGVERAVREFAALGMDPRHISVTDPYVREWREVEKQQLGDPESWGHGLRNQVGLSDLAVQTTSDPYSTLDSHQDVILMGTDHPEYLSADRLKALRQRLTSDMDVRGRKKSREQMREDRREFLEIKGVKGLDPVMMTARMMGREGKILIDTFDFFSDEDYKIFLALGWKIKALGKGHLPDLENALTTEDRVYAVTRLIRELNALRGQPQIEDQRLDEALAVASAKLQYLKKKRSSETASGVTTRLQRIQEEALAKARYEEALVTQQLADARRNLAEALEWFDNEDQRIERLHLALDLAQSKLGLAQLQIDFAQKVLSEETTAGLPGQIDRAETRISGLKEEQIQSVKVYEEASLVRPAILKAAGVIKRSRFLYGVPAEFLMRKRPPTAAEDQDVQSALTGSVDRAKFLRVASQLNQAYRTLDYQLVESLSPQELDQMMAQIRQIDELHRPDLKLESERSRIPYWVYGERGKEPEKHQVDAELIRPFRWWTDLDTGRLQVEVDPEHLTNITLKQLPNMLDEQLPELWGRYFVVVTPKLVPVVTNETDQEGQAAGLEETKEKEKVKNPPAELRAYPPGFDDLPADIRMWLVKDVFGKGYTLSTVGSPGAVDQNKVAFIMPVDPFGAGSGRAGWLVRKSTDPKTGKPTYYPVVAITPEGYEVSVSFKGIGLFVGGDERFPHTRVETLDTTSARQVSGGMTASGAIGQSFLEQVPGFVPGIGSEHGLYLMSMADGYFDGLAPRLMLGYNFILQHAPRKPDGTGMGPLFMTAREEFDTDRAGWRFRKDEPNFDHETETVRTAEKLGAMQAELLAYLPHPTIHIALTLDNVQKNGYFTDPDSIVPPLYKERNPHGSFFKYFGWALQNTCWGWLKIKASGEGDAFEIEDRHLRLLRPWLRGFMRHFLASGKVRRGPFEKFNRLSKMDDNAFLGAIQDEYGEETAKRDGKSTDVGTFRTFAKDLIDTIWENYLAYQILKDRIKHGYSYTVESTYTSTAKDQFDPYNPEKAKRYLASHRNVIEISRRNVEEGLYPLLDFNFDRAFEELKAKEEQQAQSAAEQSASGNQKINFSEVYPLSFYPPEVKPVVSLLDLEAARRGEADTYMTGGPPEAAPIVEKEVVHGDGDRPMPVSPQALPAQGRLQSTFTLEGVQGPIPAVLNQHLISKTVVIYLHGLVGDMNDKVGRWVAEALPDVSVVRYTSSRQKEIPPDFPAGKDRVAYAFGEKGAQGTKTFQDEVTDLETVIDGTVRLFERINVPPDKLNLFLVGRSLGGQIVPIVAHKYPKPDVPVAVKGIISITGSMETISGEGRPPEKWHPIVKAPPKEEVAAAFSRYTGPSLVIVANDDSPKRIASAKEFSTYAQGEFLVKGVDDVHGLVNPTTEAQIKEAIRAFVTNHDQRAGLEEILSQQQAGLEQAPTLGQWQAALQNDVQAAAVLAEPHYPAEMVPAKQQQLLRWIKKLTQLQTPQGEQAFVTNRRTVMARTPGRFPDPPAGPHLDLPGFMGGSSGFPTREELVTFVQVVDGHPAQAEVYVVEAPGDLEKDYEAGPRTFLLTKEWVNPPESIRTLEQWEKWAIQTKEKRLRDKLGKGRFNYADDMVAALIAIMKTEFGIPDASTRQKTRQFFQRLIDESKVLRIGIASDLPAGGGMSSSSAVLIAIAQAIDVLADLGLTPDPLTHLGWAERIYTEVVAGTKDHAHILNPPAYLGVLPTRVEAQLPSIPGFDLVALDSGVARENASDFSKKLGEPGNDEQNIKGRSGTGYALGALWIRRLIRQLENGTLQFSPQDLQNPFLAWIQEPTNRQKLKAGLRVGEDTANLVGFLRELLPGGKIGLDPPLLYGLLKIFPERGLSPQGLRNAFEDSILADLESELNAVLHGRPPPPPDYRYPIREMVLFALASESRNEEAAQIRQQLGKGVPAEEVFEKLVPIVRTQHNADRIVKYEIRGSLDGGVRLKQVEWDWHMPDARLDDLLILSSAGAPQAALWRQPGWMERSIEPLDRLVDLIEFFNQEIRKEQRRRGEPERDVAVAQLIGAGLGGVVAVLVKSEYLEQLKGFLAGVYYRSFLNWDPHQEVPAKIMRPGRPASVLSLYRGLDAVAAEILEVAQRLSSFGIQELSPQWRGIDPSGRYSSLHPLLVSLRWTPGERVDGQEVARRLREKLKRETTLPPELPVQAGSSFVAVVLPQKQWAMGRILDQELPGDPGQWVALIVADSPEADFLTIQQVHEFPTHSVIQVLVQGQEAPIPAGYPANIVRAAKDGDGVDRLLDELLEVIEKGGQYDEAALLNPDLPAGVAGNPIRPERLVVFLDVDDTLLARQESLNEEHSRVKDQVVRTHRRQKIVRLAKHGVHFRLMSGKALDEVSGGRVFSDEERVMRPLVADFKMSGVPFDRVGYDGALGAQKVRIVPTGDWIFSRVDPPSQIKTLSDQEAATILRLMKEAVIETFQTVEGPIIRSAGLEEWGPGLGVGVGQPPVIQERPTVTLNQSAVAVAEEGPLVATVTELKEGVASLYTVPASPERVGQPVLIVAPDGLDSLTGTSVLLSAGTPEPLIEALAQDEKQQERVQTKAAQLGFTQVRVHNVTAKFDGNVGQWIAALEWEHLDQGDPFLLVTGSVPLVEIARFLGIPEKEAQEIVDQFQLELIVDQYRGAWL